MSKTRWLVIVTGALCMTAWLGCMPHPATADKTTSDLQAAQGTPGIVDQSNLPPELAALSREELCELMCEYMGGMGAAMCQAMHAAGIEMDQMVMDPATAEQLAAIVRANQAEGEPAAE